MTDVAEEIDLSVLEDFRLHYQSMGYRLILSPKDSDLPRFLQGMRPDAIARRADGKEGVVIIVRQLADNRHDTRELTKALSHEPKWTLDVILTDRKFPRQSYLLPSVSEIKLELRSIREDVERNIAGRSSIGSTNVILLHTWPIFEAAARRAIFDAVSAPISDLVSSKGLIEALVSEDLVNDEDAEFATRLMLIHQKVVHGFLHGQTNANDILRLTDITERLVDQDASRQ
jgi:hypothetical protein